MASVVAPPEPACTITGGTAVALTCLNASTSSSYVSSVGWCLAMWSRAIALDARAL